MSIKIFTNYEFKLLQKKVVPNLLERNFKQNEPGKVLLTDITYLNYRGHTAYLSLILDASTNEVLAHHITDNLRMTLVTETLKN